MGILPKFHLWAVNFSMALDLSADLWYNISRENLSARTIAGGTERKVISNGTRYD